MKYSFVLEEKQGTNDWEADFLKKLTNSGGILPEINDNNNFLEQ